MEVPVLDDREVLTAPLDFIKRLGARYDGHPDIVRVEIGSVGWWDEWHMSRSSDAAMPTMATRKKIVDAYLNAFQETPLIMLIGGEEKPERFLSITETMFATHYQTRRSITGPAEAVGFRDQAFFGNRLAIESLPAPPELLPSGTETSSSCNGATGAARRVIARYGIISIRSSPFAFRPQNRQESPLAASICTERPSLGRKPSSVPNTWSILSVHRVSFRSERVSIGSFGNFLLLDLGTALPSPIGVGVAVDGFFLHSTVRVKHHRHMAVFHADLRSPLCGPRL